MSSSNYTCRRLPPVSPNGTGNTLENALIAKVRAFRLESLQTAPNSFASSYDEEVEMPIERTTQRLCMPQSTHYVAFTLDPTSTNKHLSEEDWIGSLATQGPEIETPTDRAVLVLDPWASVQERERISTTQLIESGLAVRKSLHYHFNAIFVRPNARGHGVGESLIRTAMDVGLELGKASGALEIRHTLALNSDNISALRLYQKLGFKTTHVQMYTLRARKGVEQENRETTVMECLIPVTEV